jgi:eukaryotic-like serine/threonine-protein kinase
MNVCPSEDLLRGLLDERLQGCELDEVVIHVEICPLCQEHLENLTHGHGGKTTQKELSPRTDIRDEATAVFIARPDNAPDVLGRRLAEIDRGSDRPHESEGNADDATTDHDGADQGRTATHIGSGNGYLQSDTAPHRPDSPRVRGYDIVERLGEGGMGVVYKARQQGLNRLVALKMIRGGAQARLDHVARFRIEAEAVARLRHPNIIQIYETVSPID